MGAMEISAEIAAAQTELFRRRAIARSCSTPRKSGWLSHLSELKALPTPVNKQNHIDSPSRSQNDQGGQTFALLPDMAAALLRHEKERIGRIWYLLRTIDQSGSGKIEIAQVRRLLCENSAEWRVVGWRQMRNLLADGKGIFWERDKTHLWLKSQIKVAHALGIGRFHRDAIKLDIRHLLGSIVQVRAHFYAAVHAGRTSPISRATLEEISGVCAESQRKYERQTAIRPKAQFAILFDDKKGIFWKHRNAAVEFVDHKGRFGKAGQKIILRQLPNCYESAIAICNPRKKRRLNQKLADLQTIGDVGNSWQQKNRRYCVSKSQPGNYFQSGKMNFWYLDERGE